MCEVSRFLLCVDGYVFLELSTLQESNSALTTHPDDLHSKSNPTQLMSIKQRIVSPFQVLATHVRCFKYFTQNWQQKKNRKKRRQRN
jgi:hypothetical protein